jgi:hypothetical protein
VLVTVASNGARTARNGLAAVALVVLVAMSIVGVRLHQRYWLAAADLRERVEQAAAANVTLRACPTVELRSLPDSVSGAYVFRNGAAEAFSRDLGIRVGSAGATCAFSWAGGQFVDELSSR